MSIDPDAKGSVSMVMADVKIRGRFTLDADGIVIGDIGLGVWPITT